jgi:hypothetical protein
MADRRVTCVTKFNRVSQHEAITHLGGYGWKLSRLDVVQRIEARLDTFYTFEGGKRADIAVREGPHGKYLQTHADGYWNNNLLSLPECP